MISPNINTRFDAVNLQSLIIKAVTLIIMLVAVGGIFYVAEKSAIKMKVQIQRLENTINDKSSEISETKKLVASYDSAYKIWQKVPAFYKTAKKKDSTEIRQLLIKSFTDNEMLSHKQSFDFLAVSEPKRAYFRGVDYTSFTISIDFDTMRFEDALLYANSIPRLLGCRTSLQSLFVAPNTLSAEDILKIKQSEFVSVFNIRYKFLCDYPSPQ